MRADKFFAARFGSRTKAHDALEAGLVQRDGKPLSPKDDVSEDDSFFFCEAEETYVSNGGYKLAQGLAAFGGSVEGKVFADLGASTGGFTDCLLQNGAAHVYSVDVGKSQLDASLASSPRVTVMDGTNARYLTAESFPEPIGGVAADLSFISLRLVLPAVAAILIESGEAYLLFKPQFECGGKGLGKSGILPPARHAALLRAFYADALACGLAPTDIVNAPVRAGKNIEYVVLLKKGGTPVGEAAFSERAAKIREFSGKFFKTSCIYS